MYNFHPRNFLLSIKLHPMRYLLAICIGILFSNYCVAQPVAMNDPQYVQTHFMSPGISKDSPAKYKVPSTMTTVGKYVMIGGAGVAVLGGLGLVTSFANNYDKRHLGTDSLGNPVSVGNGKKFCTAVTIAGASTALAGALIYLAGKATDRKNLHHLQLISQENKVGMAFTISPRRRFKD